MTLRTVGVAVAKPGTSEFAYKYYGDPKSPGYRKNLETYEFYPGVRITTHRAAKAAFQALGRVMHAHKYKVNRGDTGAYNLRVIVGTNRLSNHSWGLALDVNWTANPYGPKLVTDMPKAMVNDILAIKTRNGKQVFRWGGNYSRKKDAMHYEIMVTPADLATGIIEPEITLVPWGVPKKNPTVEIEDDMIVQGSQGPYVKQVQRLINGVNYRSFQKKVYPDQVPSLLLDGKWGPASQDALAHAMIRAAKVNNVDFHDDYSLQVVTPAMVTHLYYAAAKLADM